MISIVSEKDTDWSRILSESSEGGQHIDDLISLEVIDFGDDEGNKKMTSIVLISSDARQLAV